MRDEGAGSPVGFLPPQAAEIPTLTCAFAVDPQPEPNRRPILTIDAPVVHDALQHLTCPRNRAGGRRCRRLSSGRQEVACSTVCWGRDGCSGQLTLADGISVHPRSAAWYQLTREVSGRSSHPQPSPATSARTQGFPAARPGSRGVSVLWSCRWNQRSAHTTSWGCWA